MSIILDIRFLQHRKHSVPITKTNWIILFWEMINVCSGSHTESTNMMCGKVDFVILMQVVCTVTIVFQAEYIKYLCAEYGSNHHTTL